MLKFIRVPYSLRYDFQVELIEENRQRVCFVALLFGLASLAYLYYNTTAPHPHTPPHFKGHMGWLLSSAVTYSFITFLILMLRRGTDEDFFSAFIEKSFLCLMTIWVLWRGVLSTKYGLKIETFSLGIILLAISYRGSPLFIFLLISLTGSCFIVANVIIQGALKPFPNMPITIYTLVTMLLHLHIENNRIKLFMAKSELEERNRELEVLSFRDHLSGLYNRRYIMNSLKILKEQMESGQAEPAVLLLDIDHFKKVNDRLGHPVGDTVLQEFAGLLESCTRDCDLVGRYGGEEFIIILPKTGKEEALSLADNILAQVRDHNFSSLPWQLTVSLGCGMLEADESLDRMIERIDKRLYKAKNSGRDQVR